MVGIGHEGDSRQNCSTGLLGCPLLRTRRSVYLTYGGAYAVPLLANLRQFAVVRSTQFYSESAQEVDSSLPIFIRQRNFFAYT